MKKKILLITLMSFAYFTAQMTYVKGDIYVKVEEKTLFYTGKGLTVGDATATVENEGNIQVAGGPFVVTNNPEDNNFLLDFQEVGVDSDGDGINDDLGYGQLIIESAQTVTGEIAINKNVNTDLDNAEIGFPFKAPATTADADKSSLKHVLKNNSDISLFNNPRYTHCLFQFNNATVEWNKKDVNEPIWPTHHYYIAPYAGAWTYQTPDASFNNEQGIPMRQHVGKVNNKNKVRDLPTQSNLNNLSEWENSNGYNEVYTSYLDDNYFAIGDPNWGKYEYQFGNPYSSNIDLSYIGIDESTIGADGVWYDENGNGTLDAGEELNDGIAIDGILGVQVFQSGNHNGEYTGGAWAADSYTYYQATLTQDASGFGLFTAGDPEALLVKPLEVFFVKRDGENVERNIMFSDGLKTFSYSPKSVDPNYAAGGDLTFKTGNNSSALSNGYYQLRMVLKEDGLIKNRSYVVASNDATNGFGGKLESFNAADEFQGIFTREELAEGEGLDPLHADKNYYINQINSDYLGVPIPVFINSASVGDELTVDFDLLKGLSELSESELSFADANAKYYFHDIYLDEYFEIFNNSSYTFTIQQGDGTEDGTRFELFFGEIGTNLGVEDIQDALTSTVIFQNNKENVVRFDKEWSKANIQVFTAVGQLVYSKDGIETAEDFILPINSSNSTVYIVKIENPETGEVVSKKIID